MEILAIDPATKCGWAHSCGQYGVWDLSVKKDESGGMRLIRFRSKIEEIYRGVGVDFIAYEGVRNARPGMQRAVIVQSEIQGVLKLWCEENEVDFRAYSPSEVKKHATGKGNANKEAMIDAAEHKWKRIIEDDNIADALWILDLARTEYDE